jgi:pimeloyl-ACP methyl ester carboxylesterase
VSEVTGGRPGDDPPAELKHPWRHRHVAANGIRFHVVTGRNFEPHRPLVLLLHGFPQLWWAWRFQLPALDAAGFSVAAMDLRGYGQSDMTPRGYDPQTTAGDVAGVIKSLGFSSGVVVGQDWGGLAAWAAAAYAREQVQALVGIATSHPLARSWFQQLRSCAFYQVPVLAERRLLAHDGLLVERLLRDRAADGKFLTAADVLRYRQSFLPWPGPHCALQYQRRYIRGWLRSSGRDLRRTLRQPLDLPVLMIHGDADPVVPVEAVAATRLYVMSPPQLVRLPGVGHYPPEEAPDTVNAALVDWLRRT